VHALIDQLRRYPDILLRAVAERTHQDRKYRLPPISEIARIAQTLANLRRAGFQPPRGEVQVFRVGSREYAHALERARVEDPPRAEAIKCKGWVKCYPLEVEHT
jgi:hypothetical protein